MKELQEILKRISQFAENEKAILATVVDVVGSSYRRAGGRMLINADGYSIGTVSGGCLEADVLERAKAVLSTNAPTVITYDTTRDENSVFGLGMGCRGIIRVLFEPVRKNSEIFRTFKHVIETRQKEVVATLISSEENESIGSRILYGGADQFNFGHYSAELIESLVELKEDCRAVFNGEKGNIVKTYETVGGAAEFFIERIEPPLSILVFGAGFDALPLQRFAKEIGWRVTVVDHRAAFANAERLPEADEIINSRSEDLPEELFTDSNTAAVMMTHNYERDREILYRLLNSNFKYIGALGPKTRAEKLIAELRAANRIFDEANLAKLHAPVGLDIGADTPEAIALSIVAEIQSVQANRDGGFLRLRRTSIYNRK